MYLHSFGGCLFCSIVKFENAKGYFREGCFDNPKLVDEKAWDLEMINDDDDEESDLGE